MRIAYFDCFAGVSGDMILGALVDAGLEIGRLESGLSRLAPGEFRLEAAKTARGGISGTKLTVVTAERGVERRLADMLEIIDRGGLDEDIRAASQRIFADLAAAEAGIHGRPVGEVHFHELSGLDSLVDVVGSQLGLRMLGVEASYASRVHVGTGFVECRHGTLPVPAPASLELLKGIPVYSKGIESELATPTGIAILKNSCRAFGPMPDMTIDRIGYGAGSRELKIPNLLRVSLGEMSRSPLGSDEALLIETNIDDMNPEFFGHVSERLLALGALDVFMTPVYMKKNRPAVLLSVLAARDKMEAVLSAIFSETTTLGVRMHAVERRLLDRETMTVKTALGDVRVKVGRVEGEIRTIAPEYEDCRQIASTLGVPLKDVYGAARDACREALGSHQP